MKIIDLFIMPFSKDIYKYYFIILVFSMPKSLIVKLDYKYYIIYKKL